VQSSLLLPLAAGDSFAEALVVFLGLLVYVVPALLRAAKEKREKGKGAAPGRKPGRRPGRRASRGGGMFTGEFNGPQAPGGGSQPLKDAWRELLEGRPSTPPPGQRAPTPSPVTTPAAQPMPPPMQTPMRPPLRAPAPAPVRPRLASDEGDLVELEHAIDDLHETLDRRHEQMEQTRARLPSESQDSVLVKPRLALLPSEDSLETQLSPRAPLIPQRPVTRVASLVRAPGAWRHAVVLSEILARPIALRPPSEAPGRLPG